MLRVRDKKSVYYVAINAVMGSFLFGFELVNISMLMRLFQNINNLSTQTTSIYISIIIAALPLGAILGIIQLFVGSFLLKKIMKNIKARFLMIYTDIIAIICIIIQCIQLSFWPIFLGRIVLGFIVGINSGLVPQYIYSVTPTSLSGSVGSLHQVFIMIGVTISYALGFIINPDQINNPYCWRIIIGLPIITCLIRSINLLFFLPYLIQKFRYQIPSNLLKQNEIVRLERYYYHIYENYTTKMRDSMKQCLSESISDNNNEKSQHRHNLIICLVLAMSNQLCGINAIIFYAKQLFMKITSDNNTISLMLIVLLGIVQVLSSLASGFMMDLSSKRNFLIFGQLVMLMCLSAIFILQSYHIVVIVLIFCHTIAYSFSVGQLMMYYAAKMLRNSGYIVLTNWSLIFLVALTADLMMKWLGIGKMCLFFAIQLLFCLVILFFGIPHEVEVGYALQQQLVSQKNDKEFQMSTNEDTQPQDLKITKN